MAGSPRFKVHNPSGEYVASCKHAEDAAMIVGNYGAGAFVKDKYTKGKVWEEGKEEIPAGESYDRFREIVHARIPHPLED